MLIFSIKNEKINDEITRYLYIFCMAIKLNLNEMAFLPKMFETIVTKGHVLETHLHT